MHMSMKALNVFQTRRKKNVFSYSISVGMVFTWSSLQPWRRGSSGCTPILQMSHHGTVDGESCVKSQGQCGLVLEFLP